MCRNEEEAAFIYPDCETALMGAFDEENAIIEAVSANVHRCHLDPYGIINLTLVPPLHSEQCLKTVS